jgi:hypothetical protein
MKVAGTQDPKKRTTKGVAAETSKFNSSFLSPLRCVQEGEETEPGNELEAKAKAILPEPLISLGFHACDWLSRVLEKQRRRTR